MGCMKEIADTHMFTTYGRMPILLIRGKGCLVWDDTGKEYIDFLGGIAVCALGHSSPVVTKALDEQSRTLVHVSNIFYTKPQIELAQLLTANSFADRVFFCNSGAEANEAAIKLARKYHNIVKKDGQKFIVSMNQSFHGRTMGTLSATGQEKIKTGFEPLLEGFRFVDFNDINQLDNITAHGDVGAILLEPIQGEGGVVCAQKDYLEKVRSLCDDRDIILIFDEVQVGMGRTGKLFAYEHFGITPDIMTLAKALGNGLPIGAMLAKEKLAAAFQPGSHATTFGGTPLVTAVAKAVLTSILNDGILENTVEMGQYFRKQIKEQLMPSYKCIKGIRGEGLIIGLELSVPGTPIVKKCMDMGLLLNCTQDTILRFLPPLIVQKNEIDSAIQILAKAFEEYHDC